MGWGESRRKTLPETAQLSRKFIPRLLAGSRPIRAGREPTSAHQIDWLILY